MIKYLTITTILLSSCYDGEINGHKYKLKWECTESHLATATRLVNIGKVLIPQTYTYNICDCGSYDTIWIDNN